MVKNADGIWFQASLSSPFLCLFYVSCRIQTIQRVEQEFTDKAYQEQLPMVARATASVAIKNNLCLSEVIAEPNIIANQLKALTIIHRHIEQRKEERNQDPSESFLTITSYVESLRYLCHVNVLL